MEFGKRWAALLRFSRTFLPFEFASDFEIRASNLTPFLFCLFSVAFLEFLNAARAVDKFLFPGKKWVTARADFHAYILFRGPRMNHAPAITGDGRVEILGVNFIFHGRLLQVALATLFF
jgi:hypothetical protein